MLKIGIMKPRSQGVYYHRLLVPFTDMKEKFDISVFDGLHATENHPWIYDVLIYNRFSQPLDFLKEAKKRGVKLIADIDDCITLPKSHPNYNYYHSNEQVEHLKESIRIADVVWCSTYYVKQQYLFLNRNIFVVPNALDFTEQQWCMPKTEKYFLGGSFGALRYKDLLAFSRVVPKGLSLCLAGDNGKEEWKEIKAAFNGVETIAAMEAFEYGSAYAHFKVGFSYLADAMIDFSNYKSELKMIESGAYNLPFIATKSQPYKQLPKAGGYLCENKTEWHNAIKKLKDPERRADMGAFLGEFVRLNYNLQDINKIRYGTIIS